jgi:hypothetical protein
LLMTKVWIGPFSNNRCRPTMTGAPGNLQPINIFKKEKKSGGRSAAYLRERSFYSQ